MDLKQKTVSGLSWSFAGNFAGHAITFVVGIILARLLNPREYGLIGMVTIFTVLTQPFINSGFSQALIRKKDCTETEYSTVFYFNLFAGTIFYILVYLVAPYISQFFHEPELTKITRVIGLIIVIDAATLIQTTILTRNVNFKLQTKISLTSSFLSGILGIAMAFMGYGVWSLVFKTIVDHTLKSLLLWLNNRWKPKKTFSFPILKELFGFSSKLLGASILDKVYSNIYNLVIARYFSAKDLGLFSRAKMFKDMVALNISEIVAKVSFPVLASIQDEPERIKENYKKILTTTNFIIWILLFGLAAIAEPLIITLIGEQWQESVIYLQLLCFVGIFYPMHALTRNILYVYGHSGLVLNLEIFTKILAIPAIFSGFYFGIKYLIMAMIVAGFIEFLVKAYYSGKLVGYPILLQINDLRKTFFLALFIGIVLFLIGKNINTTHLITLIIQVVAGGIMTFSLSELFKLKEYSFIKEIARSQLIALINRIKR